MFTKLITFSVIFSICWIYVSGNNLDHYGYGTLDGTTSTERINAAMRCVNVNPQNSVDLEQIMGLWYGSEIIIHSQDVPGVYEYDSCVIIHLTDVTQQILNSNSYNYNHNGYNTNYNYNNNNNRNLNQNQNNYRPSSTTPQYVDNDDYLRQPRSSKYLRLVWSERDNNLEYTFNYTTDAPGLWSNIGDQRGSLVALNTYTQFTGTVQVVKAVNDHLVLTFCGNDVKSSIYTVVLTRNRLGLSADELRSIRNMLSRRGLYTETIRKVCNGAASLGSGILWLSTVLLLLVAAWGQRQ